MKSADSHYVLDQVDEGELEQLAVLFSRVDTDHDGVLMFGEFCQFMLLVSRWLPAHYTERELRHMFRKVRVRVRARARARARVGVRVRVRVRVS